MDQVKTGKFIQKMRKEQQLTQRQIADKLNISDKTVSKWETGNGLPEVGLMLPLCSLLHINVNELLSGERLDGQKYQEKAEVNIMDLLKEKAEAKRKIVILIVQCIMTLLSGITLIMTASFLEMQVWVRIVLIVIAAAVMVSGIIVACVMEREAGVYECPCCGERFVPTMKEFVSGLHTFTKRKLKCPKCGKVSYCKKKLSKMD